MIELALGRRTRRSSPRSSRRDARLPAAQLLSGAHLHGRLGCAAARLHARRDLGRGPPEDGVVGVALPAARVLAVPIVDTSFVVAKRLKHGLPVYESDRSHLHHRFLNIGYSQPRAVLTIYAWCATLARGRARDAVHPASPARRLAPVARRGRRADRPRRARRVDLHRLSARDRQAREPDHPAEGAARARAPDGLRIEQLAEGVFASIARGGRRRGRKRRLRRPRRARRSSSTRTSRSRPGASCGRRPSSTRPRGRSCSATGTATTSTARARSTRRVVATARTAELMRERTEAGSREMKAKPVEDFDGTPFAEIARTELPTLELHHPTRRSSTSATSAARPRSPSAAVTR